MEQIDNKTNILNNALKLFAARGYEAVGIQEIVEASKITKPTLYYYFGSKQGLLSVLLTHYFEQLYDRVKVAAEYRGDLPLNISNLFMTYFNFAKENPTFYRLQLSMRFAAPDSEPFKVVSELNEKHYRLLEAMFKNAVKDHGNMQGRHKAYAATLLGMINTYITLSLNNNIQLDDALLYQAVHQFMYGIFS